MRKESFVFHAEYLDDLPEGTEPTFAMYIFNYAIYGIEPELSGFEKTTWIKIKRRVDRDIGTWEKTKQDRSTAGKKHTGNQYTRKMEQNGTEWNKMEQNGTNGTVSVFVPVNESVNVSESGNVSVNDNVSESVNEFVCNSPSPVPFLDDSKINRTYSKQVFEILKDNDMPCCNKNEISFAMQDFKNAMYILHTRPDLRGIHSNDVLKALNNYIGLIKRPDVFEGYANKKRFDEFVGWKEFRNFMPGTFDKVKSKYMKFNSGLSPGKGMSREDELRILQEEGII